MGDTNENRSIGQWTRRDQALDSGITLAAGFAAAATIGFFVGILTSADVLPAIGFATLVLGVLCLLSAGLTGGQYAAGGVGIGAARHMFVKESFAFGPTTTGPPAAIAVLCSRNSATATKPRRTRLPSGSASAESSTWQRASPSWWQAPNRLRGPQATPADARSYLGYVGDLSPLQAKEPLVGDTWTINYLPTEGGRLTGKLQVTDSDVRFEALYDSSNSEIVKGILGAAGSLAASGGHVAYIKDSGSDLSIVLPRTEIANAEQVKKGLMKRAVITMNEGSTFTFDYGMLSPKKLIAALNS